MTQQKPKIAEQDIDLELRAGTFSTIFRRFGLLGKETSGFDELAVLRSILSQEKARLLHVLKTKKPLSIYQLARFLGRDFKAVARDIQQLSHFGIVSLRKESSGKRARLRPIINLDVLRINLRL